MESLPLLDCAGRRRSPATTSGFHEGLSARNKGLRYPPDPPTVDEIVSVMRAAGDSAEGVRLRCIIVQITRISNVPIWRSRRGICPGSITPRSSLPSANDRSQ